MTVYNNSHKIKVRPDWYKEDKGMEGPFGRRYYEEWVDPEATKREVDFLVKRLGLKPADVILDLACGTGRISRELIERRGFKNVFGQDVIPSYLNKCRREIKKNCNYLQLGERFCLGDMTERIVFPDLFDFVLLLGISFGLSEHDDVNKRVLALVTGSLKKNGKFVLEVWNRDYVAAQLAGGKITEKKELGPNTTVEIIREYDAVNGILYMRRTRRYKKPVRIKGELVSSHHDSQSLRLYTCDQLTSMCREVRMIVESIYGDYEGNNLTLESKKCILIAEKKNNLDSS